MTRKPPRVRIPARYYDAALAFCNARLREAGKPSIKRLPAGQGGSEVSCPCARACRVSISVAEWWKRGYTPIFLRSLPFGVRVFVAQFDRAAGLRRALPVRGVKP